MRITSLLIALIVAQSAISQNVVTTIDNQQLTPNYKPIVQADGKTLLESRGVWRAKGYGYLAEITDTEVRLFNETSSVVWKQADFEQAELLFSQIDDKRALITPDKETIPYVVERLEAFPQAVNPEAWSPSLIYTAFAETMDENYAFFKERDFDWKARMRSIKSQVNDELTEKQLFALLNANLEGIDDAHVQLGAMIDGESERPAFGMSMTEKRVFELFAASNEADFDEFLGKRVQKYETELAVEILQGKPQQACNQLTWGVMNGNVGYLHIAGMSNFSESETASQAEQLQELHAAMNRIVGDLCETRMLVIDVCINGGGSDVYSQAIASHFADKRRLAFSKAPRNFPEVKHSVFIQPYSGDGAATYTKPIYLVTNDVTLSAAEIFVLCMKDFPHVKTVGKSTRGALSDVLSKTLPNGWAFGLSNEVYLDSKGKCYEAIGIPPDVELQFELIDPSESQIGHVELISKVSQMSADR